MRIISEKYCKCSCGAQLAYTDEDVFGNDGNNFVICPQCKNQIFLNEINVSIHTCDKCGENFEPETYIGAHGDVFAVCPHCGNEEWINEGVSLDSTNLSYPQHFYHCSENAVKISDVRITEWVRECLDRIDKDSDYCMTASGDTLCIVAKTDEELNEVTVYVCKNYSECQITLPENYFNKNS